MTKTQTGWTRFRHQPIHETNINPSNTTFNPSICPSTHKIYTSTIPFPVWPSRKLQMYEDQRPHYIDSLRQKILRHESINRGKGVFETLKSHNFSYVILYQRYPRFFSVFAITIPDCTGEEYAGMQFVSGICSGGGGRGNSIVYVILLQLHLDFPT